MIAMSNRGFMVATVVMLLLTTIATALAEVPQSKADSSPIVVPDDYPTIQAAIGNATADSTVFVKNGTYYETLSIEKPLSLIGEDSKNTIIKGIWNGHIQRPTIQISADNVMVSGFTVTDSLQVGIWVERIGSDKQPLGCRITRE